MFPLAYPFDLLSEAKETDWVLDPFCGRGTTLFASRLRGCSAVGIDSNKVAVAISAAKLAFVSPKEIVSLCKKLIRDNKDAIVPEGQFWEACFDKETLVQIAKVRQGLLDKCESDTQLSLRALMLGILHGPQSRKTVSYLSNQMTRTFSTKPRYSIKYWAAKGLCPPRIDVIDLVQRRANFVYNTIPAKVPGKVILADSRKPIDFRPENGFKWVVTSPPYLGMVTYKQDQWLRDWFVGGDADVDYTKGEAISYVSTSNFEKDLAKVWKNVADVCSPNARLTIRMGVLPSYNGDAREILTHSLENNNSAWEIIAMESAGSPGRGMRQAEHFGSTIGPSKEEIDCYAMLK